MNENNENNVNESLDAANEAQTQGNNESSQVLNMDQKKIAELTAQLEASKNDFLYLKAEFDNYKRNAIKERSDLVRFGAERFIRDLLNVLDIFEKAVEQNVTAENFQTYVKGIEMTAHELKGVLNRHGVQSIESVGQPFDPYIHEALGAEETSAIAEGMVSKLFKRPYKLHEKVIRPGQVMVAKKPAN